MLSSGVQLHFQRTPANRHRHLLVVADAGSERVGRIVGHVPPHPDQRGHRLAVEASPGWSDETQGQEDQDDE